MSRCIDASAGGVQALKVAITFRAWILYNEACLMNCVFSLEEETGGCEGPWAVVNTSMV